MPRITITLLLLATGLAACSQKGPLVLPDAHTREPVMRAATPSAAPNTAPAVTAPATGTLNPGTSAGAASATPDPAAPSSGTDTDKKKKPQ